MDYVTAITRIFLHLTLTVISIALGEFALPIKVVQSLLEIKSQSTAFAILITGTQTNYIGLEMARLYSGFY